MGADLHKGVICFLCQSERKDLNGTEEWLSANYKIQSVTSVTSVMSVMSVKVSFEMGEKSSRIYNKNYYFYYIYVSSKKASWKLSLTLMTLMTLMTLPQKKLIVFLYFSFVTWSVKSTWGSWIYLLIWYLKTLIFGGLRSRPSFKNQVFWHKNGHLLATENGMSYLCTVIRKGHETDKKNFFGGRNFVRPPTNRILSVECLGKHLKDHQLQ